MKKQLISIAITTTLLAGTVQHAYADDQQATDSRHKQYIGTGIGATAGALVAGPVGFLVGGLIGNLAAKHDAMNAVESEQTLRTEVRYRLDFQDPTENDWIGSVGVQIPFGGE